MLFLDKMDVLARANLRARGWQEEWFLQEKERLTVGALEGKQSRFTVYIVGLNMGLM